MQHIVCIINNPQTRTVHLHSFSQEDIACTNKLFKERC